jgi:hypothetical protein
LSAAATLINVPFVVLHKECFKTQIQISDAAKLYKDSGRFEGTRLITYNKLEKKLLVDAGVLKESAVAVAGAPRFDRLHALRRKRTVQDRLALKQNKKIVLFSISPRAGMPLSESHEYESVPRSWHGLCATALDTFSRAARRRPDCRFVVKAKTGGYDVKPVLDWWTKREVPDNMTLETGGVATGVLRDAAGAVGFNTTGILDALAMGLPVGIIRYAEAGRAPKEFVHDYNGCGSYLHNVEDTLEWINSVVAMPSDDSNELSQPSKALLEEFVGNADGCASKRVLRILDNVLSHRQS